MKSLTIAYLTHGTLVSCTKTYNINALITEITEPYDKYFGIGNWLIIPTCDLPTDFSVDTYTIVNGQLVRASDELIAERQALRLAAETQAVTQARAARYTAETDALLFDAMEQFALDHPENEALAAWLVAKDAVRAELPKPTNNQNTIQQ